MNQTTATPSTDFIRRILDLVQQQRWWHLGPLLSDLDRERLAAFRQAWQAIHPVHRQDLVDALVELAEDHPEYDFRAIFRWLLSDEDPEVRATAIHGLWEDESPALIGPLLHLLQRDPSPRVREAAAISLGRFILKSELGELPMREVTPVVEALLRIAQNPDEDLDVRRRAIESLAYIDEPHIRDLIEAAYYHSDTRMQASALFAMGRSANPRWASYVLAELESPDPELRYEAALAAGELELADAVKPLSSLVEDEDIDVRLAAIEALGRIGGPEAERILTHLSGSGDPVIEEAAEAALEELRFFSTSDAESLLFPLLDFTDLMDEERFSVEEDLRPDDEEDEDL